MATQEEDLKPWRTFLQLFQDKVVKEVEWNNNLVARCKGFLNQKEREEVQGHRNKSEARGHKFIKILKGKSQNDFEAFANILIDSRHWALGHFMLSFVGSSNVKDKEMSDDINLIVDQILRTLRDPDRHRDKLKEYMIFYVQAHKKVLFEKIEKLEKNVKNAQGKLKEISVEVEKESTGEKSGNEKFIRKWSSAVTDNLIACLEFITFNKNEVSDMINKILVEKQHLDEHLDNLVNLHAAQQQHIEQLMNEVSTVRQTLTETSRDNKMNKEQIRKLEDLMKQLNVKKDQLTAENQELMAENAKIFEKETGWLCKEKEYEMTKKHMENEILELKEQLQETNDKMEYLDEENCRLLKELNEMNPKQMKYTSKGEMGGEFDGNTVNKANAIIRDKNEEIRSLKSVLLHLERLNTDKSTIIDNVDQKVARLEKELTLCKDLLHEHNIVIRPIPSPRKRSSLVSSGGQIPSGEICSSASDHVPLQTQPRSSSEGLQQSKEPERKRNLQQDKELSEDNDSDSNSYCTDSDQEVDLPGLQ